MTPARTSGETSHRGMIRCVGGRSRKSSCVVQKVRLPRSTSRPRPSLTGRHDCNLKAAHKQELVCQVLHIKTTNAVRSAQKDQAKRSGFTTRTAGRAYPRSVEPVPEVAVVVEGGHGSEHHSIRNAWGITHAQWTHILDSLSRGMHRRIRVHACTRRRQEAAAHHVVKWTP
jgi:hypothetical protein